MASAGARPPERRQYLDWARGIAVLIMLEAHTLDAWLQDGVRRSSVYYNLNMLGGFAAPLFLWLAGVALVLAAERRLSRGASRRVASEAIIRRGAIIFLLAFLFRLQAFIVSPGSWPITIFRVDILNVMGPSIAVTGLVWGCAGTRARAIVMTAAAATVIAMVTPIVREAAVVNSLPLWVQWHIRPFGDHTTFTLFPWAGFVFAGAACGSLIVQLAPGGRERRSHALVLAAGVALTALGFYMATRPSIYAVSSFWTSSPTYFAVRVGVMMALLAIAYFVTPLFRRFRLAGWLETFGANSLFIYWIHVELVYGYATWPLRHRLPYWGYVPVYLIFCALMIAAIRLRDRIVTAWRQPRPSSSQTTAVPA